MAAATVVPAVAGVVAVLAVVFVVVVFSADVVVVVDVVAVVVVVVFSAANAVFAACVAPKVDKVRVLVIAAEVDVWVLLPSPVVVVVADLLVFFLLLPFGLPLGLFTG